MGFVNVQTEDGTLRFQIEGDRPTALEQSKIQRIIMNQAPKRRKAAEIKKDEKRFDRTTGIKDVELRRKLARAENQDEEVLALKSMGLNEGDFTRDPRGNLALTPEGAKKFGVESDKNVIIDERGLSRADFADLSDLGRELAGGIGGALIGQAAIPVPIIGAMVGAAAGTGGAKLLEEAQEVIEGTQGQTAGEVFKDAGKEAAIAGIGEGAGQVLFKGIGKLFGKAGQDITDEQLELAGMSMKKFGVTPTLGQVGAPSLVSRQQAMTEKVIGTSPRLRKNHEAIINTLENFKSDYGASDIAGTADVLVAAAKAGNTKVIDDFSKAREGLLNSFKDANKALGAATKKDAAIDDDLYKVLREAYVKFDESMQSEFAAINALMKDADLSDIAAFSVRDIKEDAAQRLNQFRGEGDKAIVSQGNQATAMEMLEKLTNLPDEASFSQIYRARKNLNDAWMPSAMRGGGSSNIDSVKDEFLTRLDDKLRIKEVEKALKRKPMLDAGMRGNTPEAAAKRAAYRAASRQLTPARKAFAEGRKQFENLHSQIGLRVLANDVKNGVTPDVAGAASSLIKANNPKVLRDAAEAVGGESIFNPIKSRMAGEWLRSTLKSSLKDNDPTKLSMKKFRDKVDDLGSTADELFGKNVGEVRRLANQLATLDLANITDQMVTKFIQEGADDSAVSLLRKFKQAADDKSLFDKSQTMKALQSGTLTPEDAANVIASKGTKSTEVDALVQYFKDPTDLKKVQGFYMDNIIGDFGATFLTDPKQFKLFGQKLQNEFDSGRLTAVFGKDMANDMNDFGRVMVFNSKAAEGGDLVASNIAAKPIENFGKILKFGLLGKFFSSAPQYKSIMRQYDMLKGNLPSRTRAEQFLSIIGNSLASFISQGPGQVIQEGIQEGSKAAQGLMQQARSEMASRQKPKTAPAPTPVPQVRPALDPQQAAAPQPQKPLGMMGIRERAKGDPNVALALLGGLGNQEILNRQ